jgi:hypothetical protein
VIEASTQKAAERVAEFRTWDATPCAEEFARCEGSGNVGTGKSTNHRDRWTLKILADAVLGRDPGNVCVLGGCLVASQVLEIVEGRTRSSGAGNPDQGACGGSAALDAQDAGVFGDRHFVAGSDTEAPTVFGRQDQPTFFVKTGYPT